MEQVNPTKHWWLTMAQGSMYAGIGISLLLADGSLTQVSAQILGGLFILAGLFGGAYTLLALRADRSYFMELVRSVFDVGFGLAFLLYATKETSLIPEIFGFWAVMYASIHAVQAMYTSMLSGVKPPRTLRGNVLHGLNVLATIALAYSLLSPPSERIPTELAGGLMILLAAILMLLAIQQRQTLLTRPDRSHPTPVRS
ncbi:hypothetical protein [Spirosoma koreense]